MRLLLLRHAETAWTLTGQHTGRTDLELTLAGEKEALASAPLMNRLLGGHAPDALYASPRKRARRTAELVLGSSLAPELSDLLVEFDYGEYEGLTLAEIHGRAPSWNIWQDGCPGGESVADVGARADRFVELLLQKHAGQTVCAVSHGHLIRILTARLLGLPAEQGQLFTIKTTSIAEVVRKDGRFVLSQWNHTI